MPSSRVLLTGHPGVGKTTCVQRICAFLRKHDVAVCGFYTEEVRPNRQRIGFDVIDLNGERGQLAYISGRDSRGPRIGQYTVDVGSFERIALPSLRTEFHGPFVLVMDEIGKMELYSESFKQIVRSAFKNSSITILATVPIAKGRPMPMVDELKARNDVTLITVSRDNRDSLVEEIGQQLLKSVKI